MHLLLAVLGAALILGVLLDALVTTLMPGSGAGPVTRALTAVAHPLSHGRLRRAAPGWASRVGGAVLLLTVLLWVALLWLGWALVFASDPGAVVASDTRLPADWWEIVYYSGFTVFTLGVGDFVASGDGWRFVTALASFVGLFLITLAITYLVSVVSAVVSRRSLAGTVHLLGDGGVDVVRRAWDGSTLSSETLTTLTTIATQLVQVGEQHYAYPALHVFVSREGRTSMDSAITALAEVVLVLDEGLDPHVRPTESVRGLLRRALAEYRSAAQGAGSGPGEAPDPPSLQPLRDAGVPVVDDETFRRRVAEEEVGTATALASSSDS